VKGHRRRRRAKTLRLPAGQAPPPTDSAESVRIAWNAARYVSRTKRVAVTGTVSPYGVAIRVEGHAENVEEAVRDLFADPGTKSLMLAGDLLSGLVRMGRARRRRVKSAQMAWLKEVAAAAYLFIKSQEPLRLDERAPSFQRAADAFAATLPDWIRPTARDRRVMLAGFLVYSALRAEWDHSGLKAPLAKLDDPNATPSDVASTFFKRYIKPGLRSFEALDPVRRRLTGTISDPHVRAVLDPWDADEGETPV